MIIIVDGFRMHGHYTEKQMDLINNEMKKPKKKRKYVLGIEFSSVDKIEVLK